MNRFASPQIRLALLMMLGVYPIITAYLYILMPLTDGWQMWQRTVVLVPLMVATMVFGLIPALHRHFGWFIAGKARP
ncbi:hypothetical protein [Devosia limi]|nr:hypothetical protein [Devosia limi]SHF88804.1 hypothetical protein SAMN02745223_03807 [Devosia limi DSM 17137]